MNNPSVSRVILLVMDGVGIGELPDAALYGDVGSNSVANVARAVGGLHLPHLAALGLGNLTPIEGVLPQPSPQGAYGKLMERSPGKDTTTGHWELSGIVLDRPFPTYPDGFPSDVVDRFEAAIGRRVLGNRPASGTRIVEELGEEHLRTGYPIVYTSADSVFQIAAHEDVITVDELYHMCSIARELLQGEHAVGRVIARPFIGVPGQFQRTPRRRDFSLAPPGPTILDTLFASGFSVTSVGKIWDIFGGRAISKAYKAANNAEAFTGLLTALAEIPERGLIFVNCIDFDSVWGHRNDPVGYAQALQEFDERLADVQAEMKADDVLIVTGDHGCDPTMPGTDHSREHTPLLVYGSLIRPAVNLGTRDTFADVAATVADWFDVQQPRWGHSFAGDVTQ